MDSARRRSRAEPGIGRFIFTSFRSVTLRGVGIGALSSRLGIGVGLSRGLGEISPTSASSRAQPHQPLLQLLDQLAESADEGRKPAEAIEKSTDQRAILDAQAEIMATACPATTGCRDAEGSRDL